MGMLGAAFAMGFILGPAIGGILSAHSYASAGLVAAGLCAANAVAALAWLPETPQHRATRSKEPVRMRSLAAPLAASLLVTAAFAVLHVTLPLFGRDVLHDTPRRMGMLFAFMGVVSAIVQGGVVGRLAPRVGERRLAVAGALLLAAGLALAPQTSGDGAARRAGRAVGWLGARDTQHLRGREPQRDGEPAGRGTGAHPDRLDARPHRGSDRWPASSSARAASTRRSGPGRLWRCWDWWRRCSCRGCNAAEPARG